MESTQNSEALNTEAGRHVTPILVSVYTTSGAYPRHGHEKVKPTETVADFLGEAAKALHLTDTAGWVATVDGREIDASRSFADNHLVATVKIHWGPREGGGGR